MLDIHKWAIKPHIIVLDLYKFEYNTHIPNEMCKVLSSGALLKRVMLCIAALFYKMNVLQNMQHSDTVEGDKNSSKIYSIVVLPKSSRLLAEKDIELIIDMFYCNNAYEDFTDIFELMYSTVSTDQVLAEK